MKLFRFTSVARSRTVGGTPWTGDRLFARPTYTQTQKNAHTTQTLNIHAQSGIEPTVPESARAKTVHALDRSATVIGQGQLDLCLGFLCSNSSIKNVMGYNGMQLDLKRRHGNIWT
jgi:hypothetical protein